VPTTESYTVRVYYRNYQRQAKELIREHQK
jgi:hypothetical protein